MPTPRRKLRWLEPLLLGCWGLLLGVGLLALWSGKLTPGTHANSTARWPEHSRLTLDPNRPTVLVFAHPHCACTPATLGELALALAPLRERVAARAVFVVPEGLPASWARTDLWELAAKQGLNPLADLGSEESTRFGAQTSGHIVVYASSGQLLFAGGITTARGHVGEGDSWHRLQEVLSAAIAGRTPPPDTARERVVYGCALQESRG